MDESPTYVRGVTRALELLADLIRDGHPDQAIELAEHAIDLLEHAVERVQDDGDTHGCLVWAQEIHLRACAAGNPDPTALAQRLFTRATTDEWGVIADYADVLGPAGVATLPGLITEELQRLPRLVAGAGWRSSRGASNPVCLIFGGWPRRCAPSWVTTVRPWN